MIERKNIHNSMYHIRLLNELNINSNKVNKPWNKQENSRTCYWTESFVILLCYKLNIREISLMVIPKRIKKDYPLNKVLVS